MIKQIRYHKRFNQRVKEQGIDISMSCADGLFDDDKLAEGIKDLEGRDTISQDELISFSSKESVGNYIKAKKSGKKRVRFDPIFIKFAIYLRSKANNSTYQFMANIFNLPSDRTLSDYNTLDGQLKDGILHETLRQMEDEF